MADVFLSFAIENLANLATDEVESLRGVKEEVAKLSETHTVIQDSLHDAEMRQFKDKAVQKWMTDLKYMEYDVVDVLDEWMVKSHQLGTNNDGSCNSVWNFFTHYCICFKQLVLRYNIGKRMKSIDKKLDQIAKDKDRFNFQQNRIEFDVGNSRETSSRVDTVFGREDDKNKIKNKLISEGSSEPSDIPVISIVGMAGCGKTTLAQLVFNEPEVKSYFQELIWVCVSTEFDVAKIVKMIVEAIEKKLPPASGLEALSKLLWDTLQNKRFLLVLDDVWNDDYTKWSDFEKNLRKCGVQGSKIVVTTRSETVARVMGPCMHKLDRLSDDLCWSIFSGIAFEGINDSSALTNIAKEIVKKCKGLPLAVKTIAGALRRTAKTQMDWESALNAEIWERPEEGVLPALLLSYYHLSPPLKRCFRYCSLFPKDSELKMEELVQMWVAQDYIPPHRKRKREIEDIGREYFQELLERSLFQEPERDEWGNIIWCKMHDLVHDLAHFVTNGEFDSNDNPMINIKNVRHCTWIGQKSNESHLIAYLRSLVAADIDVCDIIQQLCCIRVLKFSATNNLESLKSLGRLVHLRYLDLSWSKIEALPESVMKLWNLRYLNLDRTSLQQIPESVGKLSQLRHINLYATHIKELPESISDLRHLQVLGLSGCSKLCQLPSGIQKMTSLKQLKIEGTIRLTTFPAGIGRLTSLERLDRFILTEGQCNVSELRYLNRIRGSLRIENLWLGSREEAVNAKLEDKTLLQGLELRWSYFPKEEPSRAEGVLKALRPPPSLQKLGIGGYRGLKFRGWVGEPTFSSLLQVHFWGCVNCIELPAFGNLPQLRSLCISDMSNVRKVGGEFFGSSGKNGGWFPKLETLQLEFMNKWEEWDTSSSLGGVAQMMMPCLRSLKIIRCVKLKALPPIFSQALKEVKLLGCDNLRCGTESIPLSIEKMCIECVPADLFSNLPSLPNLKDLTISWCREWTELSGDPRRFNGLRTLEIRYCFELRSLPEEFMRSLKGLQELSIYDCPLLEDVNWKMGVHMPCLRMLKIKHCGNLKVFPLIVSEALKSLVIAGCPNLSDVGSILSAVEILRLSPAKMISTLPGLPMLNYLEISGDDDVIEVPHDLIRFTELQTLRISDCSNLRSLPEEMSSLKKLRELVIFLCPSLSESCKMGKEQWSKIAHIPRIQIDLDIIQKRYCPWSKTAFSTSHPSDM